MLARFRQGSPSVRIHKPDLDDGPDLEVSSGREKQAGTAEVARPAEAPFRLIGLPKLDDLVHYDPRLNIPHGLCTIACECEQAVRNGIHRV